MSRGIRRLECRIGESKRSSTMLSRMSLMIVGLFLLAGSVISTSQNSATFQIYGAGKRFVRDVGVLAQ
jgi:hypothetical protein